MVFIKRKLMILKFTATIQVQELADTSLLSGSLFARLKLNENGKIREETEHKEVMNHKVEWAKSFEFPLKISTDPATGILDKCIMKVSVQRETKGGKNARKLGFVDINLSEFAGSGSEGLLKSYLLDGYGGDHRQDNSRIYVKVTMTHHSADPIFKVPSPQHSTNAILTNSEINPADRKAPINVTSDSQRNSLDFSGSCKVEGDEVSIQPSTSSIYLIGDCVESEVSAGESNRSSINIPSSRRLSEDRLLSSNNNSSNIRVQRTRIDAEDVIEEVLAEAEAGFLPKKDLNFHHRMTAADGK
uniref:C2 NT-type domain-containing protein n=1 Tax=Rhabditophanes sp. KR3021 TaxID=114890 RepID=A0AC35TTU3_9BILA